MTAPDWAAQACAIIGAFESDWPGVELPDVPAEDLGISIANALRPAHASGRRAGLLEAANQVLNYRMTYDVGNWKGLADAIRALAGAPPREEK